MLVQVALLEDKFAQTPLDRKNVGEYRCNPEMELYAGEVHSAGMRNASSLRNDMIVVSLAWSC